MSSIWTNHALSRMKERKLTQKEVEAAISDPDAIVRADGGRRYQKKVGKQTIFAIVKENEQREQLIISCWVNPPHVGTKDAKKLKRYQAFKHASIGKKMWLTLLNQLGL